MVHCIDEMVLRGENLVVPVDQRKQLVLKPHSTLQGLKYKAQEVRPCIAMDIQWLDFKMYGLPKII